MSRIRGRKTLRQNQNTNNVLQQGSPKPLDCFALKNIECLVSGLLYTYIYKNIFTISLC